VEGAPFVDRASPGGGDKAGHNGSDEDQVAEDVDASESVLPSSFTLVVDVQEYEEGDKGSCSMLVCHCA
jgi:hypothetical protein